MKHKQRQQFSFRKTSIKVSLNILSLQASSLSLCFKPASRCLLFSKINSRQESRSRTFQGLLLKFKDFSRLCEPCPLCSLSYDPLPSQNIASHNLVAQVVVLTVIMVYYLQCEMAVSSVTVERYNWISGLEMRYF